MIDIYYYNKSWIDNKSWMDSIRLLNHYSSMSALHNVILYLVYNHMVKIHWKQLICHLYIDHELSLSIYVHHNCMCSLCQVVICTDLMKFNVICFIFGLFASQKSKQNVPTYTCLLLLLQQIKYLFQVLRTLCLLINKVSYVFCTCRNIAQLCIKQQ